MAVGVTEMVPLMVVFPLLVAVNTGIFPFPLAPSPMLVLLFDQLNVVPVTVSVGVVNIDDAPLQ